MAYFVPPFLGDSGPRRSRVASAFAQVHCRTPAPVQHRQASSQSSDGPCGNEGRSWSWKVDHENCNWLFNQPINQSTLTWSINQLALQSINQSIYSNMINQSIFPLALFLFTCSNLPEECFFLVFRHSNSESALLQIEEITDCLVFCANALTYTWKGVWKFDRVMLSTVPRLFVSSFSLAHFIFPFMIFE